MIKKPLINNRIRAQKVRLIDDAGKQIGIIDLEKALQMARERNLDLIQVTEKIDPPVCKILNYGKYLYRLQKKEKGVKKTIEIKGIRLRFNISPHDLETRILQAEKFLKKGNKVKIEMILRGREKRLSGFAKEKLKKFIEDLGKRISIKTESEIKRKVNGFIVIISISKEENK
ncbi:MAG: translation initiation factor IF-3 [Candidatus Nealsonbacteria bacterium]|nr:MAG: translation initiation factor IF-3 [Candidatus Nealsonbacteria bacterium]